MAKVLVTAKIENLYDVERAAQGVIPADDVRSVEVPDALVDTGAMGLLMPKRIVAQLGLRQYRTRQSRGIGGTVALPMYSAVRLTIQGRDCVIDVGEIGDDLPVCIGVIPLEAMDWVVDPQQQRLVGNPAHGGQDIMDVFCSRAPQLEGD